MDLYWLSLCLGIPLLTVAVAVLVIFATPYKGRRRPEDTSPDE